MHSFVYFIDEDSEYIEKNDGNRTNENYSRDRLSPANLDDSLSSKSYDIASASHIFSNAQRGSSSCGSFIPSSLGMLTGMSPAILAAAGKSLAQQYAQYPAGGMDHAQLAHLPQTVRDIALYQQHMAAQRLATEAQKQMHHSNLPSNTTPQACMHIVDHTLFLTFYKIN